MSNVIAHVQMSVDVSINININNMNIKQKESSSTNFLCEGMQAIYIDILIFSKQILYVNGYIIKIKKKHCARMCHY